MVKVQQRVDNENLGGIGDKMISKNLKLEEQDSDEQEANQLVSIAKQVVASAKAQIKKDTTS